MVWSSLSRHLSQTIQLALFHELLTETQSALEGNSSKLTAIKLVFGLDLFIYLCSEDSHMERPRNEITGDNLITAFPQYYPTGFKIFAPKTKYIRDSCESNEDLLFSVSYKHTVLIGYFFFSSHSETKVLTRRVNDRCSQMFLRLSMKSVTRSREVTAVLVQLRKHVYG